jgi:hypothetical protein
VAVANVTATGSIKRPPFGVIVGSATVNVTLRTKAVVFVAPPPEPVTVIGKLPAGVKSVVFIVNTDEQFGVQLPDEKIPLAPEGSPDTEKLTD